MLDTRRGKTIEPSLAMWMPQLSPLRPSHELSCGSMAREHRNELTDINKSYKVGPGAEPI